MKSVFPRVSVAIESSKWLIFSGNLTLADPNEVHDTGEDVFDFELQVRHVLHALLEIDVHGLDRLVEEFFSLLLELR